MTTHHRLPADYSRCVNAQCAMRERCLRWLCRDDNFRTSFASFQGGPDCPKYLPAATTQPTEPTPPTKMNDHEDSRPAFEANFKQGNHGELAEAIKVLMWSGWMCALDWRDAQVCASQWHLSKGAEENPDDGTIVGECSGGQFVVFAPSKIPIYCPGCGRRVKIQKQQTNDTNEE